MVPFTKEGNCLADEELARYLARAPESEPERVAAIEGHLAACEECLDTLLAAREAMEMADSAERADRVAARLRGRRGSLRPSARRPTTGSPIVIAAAAAAATLFSLAGLALLLSHRPPKPEVVRQPEAPSEESPEPMPEEPRPAPPPPPRPEAAPERREPKPFRAPPPAPREELPAPPPPPRPEEPPEAPPKRPPAGSAVETRVAVEAVRGRVRWRNRDLKAGDLVSPADALKTPFGARAVLTAGGATFVVHHDTELTLGAGPVARIACGRVFVRGSPGLRVETPAASVSPVGTEFLVEVSADATLVAVREGSVLVANDQGRVAVRKDQAVRASPGRAPGRPVSAPPDAFAWALAEAGDRAIVLYPAARKSGVVLSAPHVPVDDDLHVAEFAAGTAARAGLPCVVGYGFSEGSRLVVPGRTTADRELFDEFGRLVREASGAWPARLVVVFHAKQVNDPAPLVAECGTAGFTVAEEEQLKRDFASAVERHAPAVKLRMVCEHTDPTFEAGGRTLAFSAGAAEYRRAGLFKESSALRGLRLRIPASVRYSDSARGKYEAIFAEWLDKLSGK
jgi:hypothetical protein